MKSKFDLSTLGLSGFISDRKEHRLAAWELYVELITRVSTVKLENGSGSLREAMTSLHHLFESTRLILKTYGPSLAEVNKDELSVAHVAIEILNSSIRPFLSKWHPRLMEWEGKSQGLVSAMMHENQWTCQNECRQQLEEVRATLIQYSDFLSSAAKVPNFAKKRDD